MSNEDFMKEMHKSCCLFCSLNCEFIVETKNGEAVNFDYDRKGGAWDGVLCAKGNFLLEMINHPMRLSEPELGGRAGSWSNTLDIIGKKLAPFAKAKNAGLILEGDASVEDLVTARLFAEKCLNLGRLAVNFSTGDDAVYKSMACAELSGRFADAEALGRSECTIAVGDPFEVAPVIAGKILKAKHSGRNHMLAVLSEAANRTSHFASNRIFAAERILMAGFLGHIASKRGADGPSWLGTVATPEIPDGLTAVADSFIETEAAILVLETRDPVVAGLAAACVLAAGDDKQLFVVNSYANARALTESYESIDSVDNILDDIERGELKALIVLGGDLVKARPDRDVGSILANLDFLVAGAAFENKVTALADPVLPCALWMELEGRFNGSLLNPVIDPPGAALSYGEILRRLTAKMGPDKTSIKDIESVEKKSMSDERISALLLAALEAPVIPSVASTVLRAGDGALSDKMSWNALMGREPW